MLELVLFTAIPLLATIVGGIVAAYRAPGPRLRTVLQHTAAGVVFAAAAWEILPDIIERHRPWHMAVGFGFGVALMLAIRAVARACGGSAPNATRLPC